jgi:hypothetical protein
VVSPTLTEACGDVPETLTETLGADGADGAEGDEGSGEAVLTDVVVLTDGVCVEVGDTEGNCGDCGCGEEDDGLPVVPC